MKLRSKLSENSWAFAKRAANYKQIQLDLLFQILSENKETSFGEAHEFARLSTTSYESFAKKAPLGDYESHRKFVSEVFSGNPTALTFEKPLFFERTSGTSKAEKWIPFTASSLAALQKSLRFWLSDLLEHRPGTRRGTHYWSISPQSFSSAPTVASDYVMGAPNDAVFFGEELAQAILGQLAVPPSVAQCRDHGDWRVQTLAHLLKAEDLSFISIWSPTFILELLKNETPADHVCFSGAFALLKTMDVSQERLYLVKESCTQPLINTKMLWPNLDTLSVWLDATSALFCGALRELFPHVLLQPKGLLSTEAIVSFPISDSADPVAAFESTFLEFKDVSGAIFPLWEVRPHQIYEVVITTRGGLTRYQTGDQVKVTGHYKGLPTLKFLGRVGLNSDLVGEKLTEEFVLSQTQDLSSFGFLAPSLEPRPHYIFFCEDQPKLTHQELDQRLMANPHYQYARSLGQLDCVKIKQVEKLTQKYLEAQQKRGQKLGDIKPPRLRSELEWIHWLKS